MKNVKLGAEPKKVVILAVLLAVAAVVYFMNSSPSVGNSPSPASAPTAAARSAQAEQGAQAPVRPARGQRTLTEFRPSLRPKRGEQRPDPMSIDPTLRLDVLARLQQVNVEGARRSIFDFGQPPAPKPDPVKIAEAKPKVPSPIVPVDAKPAEDTPPPKPQAPPVPFKFYGYLSPTGQPQKRAFFVEGEEIHVVREGDVVKRRYKIVRIGVNSVVVEDTQFGQQQTLPLEEQQG
jgi:hypothetical protein